MFCGVYLATEPFFKLPGGKYQNQKTNARDLSYFGGNWLCVAGVLHGGGVHSGSVRVHTLRRPPLHHAAPVPCSVPGPTQKAQGGANLNADTGSTHVNLPWPRSSPYANVGSAHVHLHWPRSSPYAGIGSAVLVVSKRGVLDK